MTKLAKSMALLLIGAVVALLIYQLPAVQKLRYPMPYREIVQKSSRQYGVDPILVTAVMREESGFMPKSRSNAGAQGLMQLMPDTAAWAARKAGIVDFRQEQLYQPETNIQLGAWYLSSLSQQFGNNTVLVLAAYNGGRGRVQDWLDHHEISPVGNADQIPIPETREYVKKVLRSYAKYRELYPENNG
ncbi:MAG TPA: lytic transglycosylase domain-containing protein [Desulfobacteria bacterium]|nr:lytic transglycosylase domain-containing protein [Desulfobacteria bacterium]